MHAPEKAGRFNVYQIYYDAASRAALDPGFLPLDNTANPRPDWYEFWVIRNFLKSNALDPGAWYGFLSPRFALKTGIDAPSLLDALGQFDASADVALFTTAWDQLAYFQNPFEQGEAWHPGMLEVSQRFLDDIGYGVDLRQLVTHSVTSVFSNYIVAKPKFWTPWLALADRLFEYVESRAGAGVAATTNYGSSRHQAPIKAFIQERLATLVLSRGAFRVVSCDQSATAPIFDRIFDDDGATRLRLQACDLLKGQYCRSGDPEYLSVYRKIRATIRYRPPV